MNLTDTHKKLKKEGYVTFNRPYFSQLVSEGKIPFKTDDKGRKHFKYMMVLKSLVEGGIIEVGGNGEKTITSTKLELYHWRGKLLEQQHHIKAGKLIYRDEVEQKAFIVMRTIRDQLLSLPERLTADIMTAHSIKDAEALIRKELEMLLDPLTPESLMP